MAASAKLRFDILGPMVVRDGDEVLDTGPHKQRVLLGVLLLRANAVVPVDRLVHAVWPDAVPRTARKNIQVYVSALRKVIGVRIRHASYGYVLDAGADELDSVEFERLTAAGYAALHVGDAGRCRELLGRAVALWRDDPLADLARNPVIAAEVDPWVQRFLAVYEDWVDLEVDAGQHLAVLGELLAQARRHPFRERLTGSAMTALNRAGRRREALAVFEAHRQLVARELGLAPSVVLSRLHLSMLGGAAGASGSLRPAQLPRDLAHFVGRDGLVAGLVEALTAPGGDDVAVITGAVGTGKTALAVRVGHRLASGFVDGQVVACLRAEDGGRRSTVEVLAELMRSTGMPGSAGAPDALAAWRSWVACRSYLFVLDDAVDADQVAALLPGSSPSRTVITSTHRLCCLDAVHRVEVGELTREESGEVLRRSLGTARVNPDALARVLRRCGSTPLAVRAVAAKLDVLRHLPLAALADRLDAAPSVFTELAAGGVPLRGRLARFFGDLSVAERAALVALGRGDLPAVEPSLLEGLVEANALTVPAAADVHAHTGYTVPALVREFAVEPDVGIRESA